MKKKGLLIYAVFILLSGCTSIPSFQEKFSPVNIPSDSDLSIEIGDTVKLNYILSTADEQVLDTSFEEVAVNWGLNLTHPAEPMAVKIGDNTIIPGLEEALIGMQEGDQKEVLIQPEKGFGPRNESLVKILPRTSIFPRVDILTLEAFKTIFRAEPVVDKIYSLNYWNTTVTAIDSGTVTILNNARNTTLETERGLVLIHVNGTSIAVTIDPILNSTIMTVEGTGRVVSIDEDSYTADLNHPLAGETILFFIRVEEIIKPDSTGKEEQIILGKMEFITSVEEANIRANETGKPVFLYVHALWCSWCRKFETDVLSEDAVLSILKSDFINVAIDVDTEPNIARNLNIFGTPTMIFLDSDGSEIRRLRGYRDTQSFIEELKSIEGIP